MTSIIIMSDRNRLMGYRYFWAKRVTGFNAKVHCARCLIGQYLKPISAGMAANQRVYLPDLKDGDVVYICGVSNPYVWRNNFHFAGVVKPGAKVVRLPMYQGDTIAVSGVVPIAFDDTAARKRYPDKGREFLTCRNFQFGAQHMGSW